ncbi:MAG: glycerol-3-phosphate acyltransferase [Actinomycetota bacterium]|nr:glycerol-3-phosphate acyltransferase [Actinomycetota bacterium]
MTGVVTVLAVVGIPRSATMVGLLAGPLIVLGYLGGSVPFAYLLSRRRLRRQLDDDGIARLGSTEVTDEHRPGRAGAGADLLAAAMTLVATTVAWELTLAATPGANTFSAVAVFSNQAIGAWVSVALWTGMAAVLGHAAPVWTGFRGGSGLPPALALTAAYTPLLLLMAAAAFLVAYGLTRRPVTSLLAALPAMVVFAYVAWLVDLQAGWGVTNGPEVTLWTAALAVTLFARHHRSSLLFGDG